MQRQKKVPIRKCLATNQPYPKYEMFRIVRTPEGEIKIDPTGKMNGRGAYISKSKEAVEIAKMKNVISRHLEAKVPEEVYLELLKQIEVK